MEAHEGALPDCLPSHRSRWIRSAAARQRRASGLESRRLPRRAPATPASAPPAAVGNGSRLDPPVEAAGGVAIVSYKRKGRLRIGQLPLLGDFSPRRELTVADSSYPDPSRDSGPPDGRALSLLQDESRLSVDHECRTMLMVHVGCHADSALTGRWCALAGASPRHRHGHLRREAAPMTCRVMASVYRLLWWYAESGLPDRAIRRPLVAAEASIKVEGPCRRCAIPRCRSVAGRRQSPDLPDQAKIERCAKTPVLIAASVVCASSTPTASAQRPVRRRISWRSRR